VRYLLDTQLLTLLAVGRTAERYIAVHKNLAAYDITAYRLLEWLLKRAQAVVVTPNVLSEASNLVRQIKEPARSQITATLGRMARQMLETYVPSGRAVQHAAFLRLGLPDVASLLALDRDTVLLTADVGLFLACERAENFTHHREARGFR
jgi:hypothetical protein